MKNPRPSRSPSRSPPPAAVAAVAAPGAVAWAGRGPKVPVWIAAGLAGLVLFWVVMAFSAWAQAQHRHSQSADAVAHALLALPGDANERVALLPAWLPAVAATAVLRVDGGPELLHWSNEAVAEGAGDRLLAPAGDRAHRRLNAGGLALELRLRAPVDDLWRAHLAVGMAATAVGLGVAFGLAWRRKRRQARLRQAVAATLAQARSLGEAGYVAPRPLPMRELRPLADAMDQLHQRLRALFAVHAEQLEALRRQAHTDAVTGLPNRRHFLAVVEAVLSGDGAPAEAGLVLVRLSDLKAMNQRLGTRGADQVLLSLAEVMASYPQRIDRCAVGRLTGGDFALLLPTGGMAHETAQVVAQALRAQLTRVDPSARITAAGVELRPPLGAAQALVMAQAALAGSESVAAVRRLRPGQNPSSASARSSAGASPHSANAASRQVPGDSGAPAGAASGSAILAGARGEAASDGEARGAAGAGDDNASAAPAREAAAEDIAWQRLLARSLVQGRVKLGAYPVRSVDGRQLLLDCPLRVQLNPGGVYEPASRWLVQAARSRLNTAVDEKAVMLALAAIAQDDEARGINIAAASAMSGEFVTALTRRLAAMPEAAARLWLDLPESLALDQPELVRELTRRWHAHGARVALEHCGEGLMRIPSLIDLGLDCVRIDGRFVNGLAGAQSEPARHYLQGLVRLVQSVGLSVTAEGVKSPADLELLWQLGFDAATGPAVAAATGGAMLAATETA